MTFTLRLEATHRLARVLKSRSKYLLTESLNGAQLSLRRYCKLLSHRHMHARFFVFFLWTRLFLGRERLPPGV